MAIQILSKSERIVAPEMRTVDALFKTHGKAPAKLEMVGDANYSSSPRFETKRRVVITFLDQFSTTFTVEQWKFENFCFDAHPPVKIRRAQREHLEWIFNYGWGVQRPVALQSLEHGSSHQICVPRFELSYSLRDILIGEFHDFVAVHQEDPLPHVASEQRIQSFFLFRAIGLAVDADGGWKRSLVNVFDGDGIRVLDGKEPLVLLWPPVNHQMKPIHAKPEIILQPRFDEIAVGVDLTEESQAH